MRRLESKTEQEKKGKRNQLILGIILIAVMLFGTLGYAFTNEGRTSDPNSVVKYNGFQFVNQNGFWMVEKDGSTFSFKFNPLQVEKIDSPVKSLSDYSGKPLYVSSNNYESTYEIYNNFGNVVLRITPACLNNETCEGNAPIKTCTDNFIIIKENKISMIKQEQNCVFIEGPAENLTKITDEFIFKTIGL